MQKLARSFGFAVMVAAVSAAAAAATSLTDDSADSRGGLEFSCSKRQQAPFTSEVRAYLAQLGIKPGWVQTSIGGASLQVALVEPWAAVSPLDFSQHAELDIRDEMVSLPRQKGELKAIPTVSKKEIALALLHPGRRTKLPCNLADLQEHIGLRQNIVAWAERLSWQWPEGGPAQWNKRYWRSGTPTRSTLDAMADAFEQQEKYAIGCYTATKMVVVQGVLDYYKRVSPNTTRLATALRLLEADGEPLVQVEPAAMWYFEADFKAQTKSQPGKLLSLVENVAPGNFVPGDWAYILNTDPDSYQKTGYEGSNAVYLGRGKFDDYYNDHSHAYSYRQKLNEVFQWRNKVFSRTRDSHLATPLSERDIIRLSLTPEEGGLVLGYRAVPHVFSQTAAPAAK